MKDNKNFRNFAFATTLATVLAGPTALSAMADTLKGSIDQTDIQPATVKTPKPVLEMPTPVLPANTEKDQLKSGTGQMDQNSNLNGKADDNVLYGEAEDAGDIDDDEGPTPAFARQRWETPDIAKPHCGPDRRENKRLARGPALARRCGSSGPC